MNLLEFGLFFMIKEIVIDFHYYLFILLLLSLSTFDLHLNHANLFFTFMINQIKDSSKKFQKNLMDIARAEKVQKKIQTRSSNLTFFAPVGSSPTRLRATPTWRIRAQTETRGREGIILVVWVCLSYAVTCRKSSSI